MVFVQLDEEVAKSFLMASRQSSDDRNDNLLTSQKLHIRTRNVIFV